MAEPYFEIYIRMGDCHARYVEFSPEKFAYSVQGERELVSALAEHTIEMIYKEKAHAKECEGK